MRPAEGWSEFVCGIGGEGGIRTLVPGFPDHPISSRRRYDRFGTSPSTGRAFYLKRLGLSFQREAEWRFSAASERIP